MSTSSAGLKAIITGATSGIGLHTLKRLYKSGSFDYIVGLGRDAKKCENVFDNELENRDISVEIVECDLTCHAQIKKFASTISNRMPKIDLLINVAGIMNAPQEFTEDGIEIHFAANHLGHFLLTKLLLPYMAQDSRIINVTSGKYAKCNSIPSWETVHGNPVNSLQVAPNLNYSQSKLANCLFTVALDSQLKQNKDKFPNVKVVAVRPGFIRGTELGRYHNHLLRMLAYPLIYLFSKDLDAGTETIVYLALATIDELESGKLYYEKKVEEYTELVTTENAQQLWTLSEKLLEPSSKKNTTSSSTPKDDTIAT